MLILLTNDDGILAPGLTALRDAFRGTCDLWVVAPERERSASAHAISITEPLRVQAIGSGGGETVVAVSGTPADCVKLAMGSLLPGPPDFVVSGINPGPNVGINVIYSGTVSAALEGAILGIPSIAISVEEEKPELFLSAAAFTRRLVTAVSSGQKIPPGLLLNVNVPDRGEEGIAGVRVTVQARSSYRDSFEQRIDPRGKVYYWLAGERQEPDPDPMTDERALKEGFISITPIQADLTARGFLGELSEWPLNGLWEERHGG